MHIIIGALLIALLLYFWLLGHWYARVLTFLLFAAVFGLGGGMMAAAAHGDSSPEGIFGIVVGAVVAWFISGLPIYYWRRQYRRLGEWQV